ncbi:hypothetical protein M3Y94_00098100 [Aphelenchoides besseyi]|nr:hypothetical protein M3Y94_00098100 [Aphelenchoides besseyi]
MSAEERKPLVSRSDKAMTVVPVVVSEPTVPRRNSSTSRFHVTPSSSNVAALDEHFSPNELDLGNQLNLRKGSAPAGVLRVEDSNIIQSESSPEIPTINSPDSQRAVQFDVGDEVESPNRTENTITANLKSWRNSTDAEGSVAQRPSMLELLHGGKQQTEFDEFQEENVQIVDQQIESSMIPEGKGKGKESSVTAPTLSIGPSPVKISMNTPTTPRKKFGWIEGVFFRCVLNIFGVILYLRVSWVAGTSGILFGNAVVLLASLVTTITTLSTCAICTNGDVKGGGAYFLAATGIMAGANISGDLANPQKSIPKGTLISIAFTTAVYIALITATGSTCLRDADGIHLPTLLTQLWNTTVDSTPPNIPKALFASYYEPACAANNTCPYGLLNYFQVIETGSLWGPLITAGIFAASLSSALASLVSAPKIFQAVAKDGLFPGIGYFAKGFGKDEEPRRDLNVIAPYISNFFLSSYALINFACFDNDFAHSPGWRPGFRAYNMWVSLIGAFLCILIMFITSWFTALMTITFFLALFFYLAHRKPDVNWGDTTQAHSYRTALHGVTRLENTTEHIKNYRPNILLLTGNPAARPSLVDFISNICQANSGGLDFSDLMKTHGVGDTKKLKLPEMTLRPNHSERSLSLTRAAAAAAEAPSSKALEMTDSGVMNLVVKNGNPATEMRIQDNARSFNGSHTDRPDLDDEETESNDEDVEEEPDETQTLNPDDDVEKRRVNFGFYEKNGDEEAAKLQEKRKPMSRRSSRRMTAAQRDLLSSINRFQRKIKKRIENFNHLIEPFRDDGVGMISDADLTAQHERTMRQLRISELLRENSSDADLIVLSLPIPRKGITHPALYMAWLGFMTSDLPPTLLIRGNQTSVLTFYS